MRKKIGGGLVLLAFTLLAACGGSEDQQTPSPTATDAETAYLEQVRTLEAELGVAFERIGEMLSRAYAVREVLFEAVARADLHSVFESVLRQAEEIAPPGRFRVDHERYVQMLRDSYPLALESERAIEDKDLLGLYISRARFAENRNTLLLETSLAFCTGTVPEDLLGIGRPSPCGRPADLPGEAYGVALYDIMQRYQLEFSPRVSSFPLGMLPDEFFTALLILNPEIEAVIAEALEAAEQLSPPEEFRTDHQRLLQYFRENLELAQAITGAARDREIDKLRKEYFPQSGVVVEAAIKDFSDEFKPLVDPYFSLLSLIDQD